MREFSLVFLPTAGQRQSNWFAWLGRLLVNSPDKLYHINASGFMAGQSKQLPDFWPIAGSPTDGSFPWHLHFMAVNCNDDVLPPQNPVWVHFLGPLALPSPDLRLTCKYFPHSRDKVDFWFASRVSEPWPRSQPSDTAALLPSKLLFGNYKNTIRLRAPSKSTGKRI